MLSGKVVDLRHDQEAKPEVTGRGRANAALRSSGEGGKAKAGGKPKPRQPASEGKLPRQASVLKQSSHDIGTDSAHKPGQAGADSAQGARVPGTPVLQLAGPRGRTAGVLVLVLVLALVLVLVLVPLGLVSRPPGRVWPPPCVTVGGVACG